MRHIVTLLTLFVTANAAASEWALIVEPRPVAAWALACEPIEAAPRARRAMLFTAAWCGPCQQMKRDTLPPLAKSGWRIGDSTSDHIQVIDSDSNPALMQRWHVSRLPTTIYIEDEAEVRRVVGFQTPVQIGELFDPPAKQTAAATYAARWTYPGSGRADLIRHLADEHNYTVESLERMTTDQLSRLHDTDHDSTTRRPARRLSLQSFLFGGG